MDSSIEKRKDKLIGLISQRKNMSIKELSQFFKESIPTLYRDLAFLERERVIKRYHGGVRYVKGTEKEHGFYYRVEVNAKQKTEIAKKAIKLIKNNDNIYLDASTTCFYLCKELKNSNFDNLTIFTNGLFIPIELLIMNKFNIISIGGVLDRSVTSFVKNNPEYFLKDFKYIKYFGTAFAFSTEYGPMGEFGWDEVEAEKKVMQLCDEINLLIDSSKFKIKGTHNWMKMDKINRIVTDKGIDKKFIDELLEKGIEVIY